MLEIARPLVIGAAAFLVVVLTYATQPIGAGIAVVAAVTPLGAGVLLGVLLERNRFK